MEDGSSWLLMWAFGHRPKYRCKKGKSDTSSFVALNVGISSTISIMPDQTTDMRLLYFSLFFFFFGSGDFIQDIEA